MANKGHIDISILLGERVRFYRKRQKMTQKQLAFEANVNRNTIIKVESGIANPQIHTVMDICAALNVQLKDVLLREEIQEV